MNISIKTPNAGVVSIRPDNFATVCPLFFTQFANTKERIAARRYCNAEGWIEWAEEQFVPDPKILAFLRTI